jgi:hypothetical protein
MEKYKLNKEIILHKNKENYLFLAYDTKNGIIFELNETAFFILDFCRKKRNFEEIIKKIEKNYSISNKQKLIKDVKKSIQIFLKKKILKKDEIF